MKKNYYMSKGVGRLKWLPDGTQNKTVFTVIFRLFPRRLDRQRVAIATWASSRGQPGSCRFVWAGQGESAQQTWAWGCVQSSTLVQGNQFLLFRNHRGGRKTDQSCLMAGQARLGMETAVEVGEVSGWGWVRGGAEGLSEEARVP